MNHPVEPISARERRLRSLFALSLALLVASLSVVVVRTLDPRPAAADDLLHVLFPTTTTTTTRPTTTTAPKPRPHVPVSTLLATPKGEINTYDGPNGKVIGKAGRWYGRAMTMPIVEQWQGWVRIRVPERPNGKTAWVRRQDVTTSRSAYRIVIRLNQTKLILYKDGFPVLVAPVGVGKRSTPTPTGNFFLAVIEDPDPQRRGAFALDTSGHSEAIRSWQGSGDAIIAIHGPVSARSDAQIGSTGTRISNGCIRMHNGDLARLRHVPLGTPVDINPR